MAYRAPIRPMRIGKNAGVPIPTTGLSALDMAIHLGALMDELTKIKEGHRKEVDDFLRRNQDQINTALAQLREAKGDKGDPGMTPIPGVHYQIPDEEAIVKRIMHKLPLGRDGKDADPYEVARIVMGLIQTPDDGKDADEEAITVALIDKIVNGRLIRPEHIAGLPEMLDDVRRKTGGGMRGGGDTVLAGSNITITKNTAGRKVISATSGGFTTLAATETPNGNITVFTFAGATAQPSFIIADNVWLRATTKAGTVNWTWNAGTKQATMIVAPADEILGIV